MRLIWLKFGSSLHLGLQDAWETTGKRMTLGIGLLGVTVVLAIVLATRQPVAPEAGLAARSGDLVFRGASDGQPGVPAAVGCADGEPVG